MKTRFSATSFGVLRKTGATALLSATFLQVPLTAHAYNVVVENPFDFDASVKLYYGQDRTEDLFIRSYSSKSYDTGFWCPNGLDGEVFQGDDFQGTDMFGTWYGNPASGFARCASVNIKICEMPPGSSKKYSFCPY